MYSPSVSIFCSPCESLLESQTSQFVDVEKFFVSKNPETSLQSVWQAQTKQERLQGKRQQSDRGENGIYTEAKKNHNCSQTFISLMIRTTMRVNQYVKRSFFLYVFTNALRTSNKNASKISINHGKSLNMFLQKSLDIFSQIQTSLP